MTDQTLDLDAIEARAKLQRRLASGAFDVVCCDDLDALTAEVRKLREAAATALGNLDDPTGGEHVADMRAAAAVLLKALKTKEPSA